MGANNSEGSTTKFWKLRAKTSDTDGTPFFGLNEKVGEGWGITQKFDSMSGNLVDIGHKTYEYEGQTKHNVEMKFQDSVGADVVQAGFNNMTFSILNSLTSLLTFDDLSITVKLGKETENKKRYPNAYVKQGGADVKWFFQMADIPKPTKESVMVGGKKVTVTVDDNVTEFWINKIDTIKKMLIQNPSKAVSRQSGKNEKTEFVSSPLTDLPLSTDDESSELPF